WMGQRGEDQAPDEPLAERALEALLDMGPRQLDQLVVLDAGRARCHAGHAAEAAVKMLDRRRRERHGAVKQRLHQIDASARRVHLLLPERPVGRTGRQAEAAVDAVGDQLAVHYAKTPCGSNSARTRSASGFDSAGTGWGT